MDYLGMLKAINGMNIADDRKMELILLVDIADSLQASAWNSAGNKLLKKVP